MKKRLLHIREVRG